MDKNGHIYEMTDEERRSLRTDFSPIDNEKIMELKEDEARLDGYLRGRADSDKPKRGKGVNKDLAG